MWITSKNIMMIALCVQTLFNMYSCMSSLFILICSIYALLDF